MKSETFKEGSWYLYNVNDNSQGIFAKVGKFGEKSDGFIMGNVFMKSYYSFGVYHDDLWIKVTDPKEIERLESQLQEEYARIAKLKLSETVTFERTIALPIDIEDKIKDILRGTIGAGIPGAAKDIVEYLKTLKL